MLLKYYCPGHDLRAYKNGLYYKPYKSINRNCICHDNWNVSAIKQSSICRDISLSLISMSCNIYTPFSLPGSKTTLNKHPKMLRIRGGPLMIWGGGSGVKFVLNFFSWPAGWLVFIPGCWVEFFFHRRVAVESFFSRFCLSPPPKSLMVLMLLSRSSWPQSSALAFLKVGSYCYCKGAPNIHRSDQSTFIAARVL